MKARIFTAVVALAGAASAAPVTRQQLVEMARGKVDPAVMRAIVERDCVDFEIDAGNAAELSRTVPAAVLEVAIACRRSTPSAASASVPDRPAVPTASAPAAVSVPTSASAPASVSSAAPPARPPENVSSSPPVAAATAAVPPAAASPSLTRIRLRAVFIGESGALRCTATVDGVEAATLVKEAQGAFGEAVPRDPIPRESPYLPVGAGRHHVAFRCDPKRQEVTAEVDVPAGESRTIEVSETTFRHWKLRRILTP
ncbi:MAG TPA: hypothetical protein VFL12_10650 [Thermoanaerobaculia bacterium]|nr:hypothetical protein [Thermoanaerobaculia bacterium]